MQVSEERDPSQPRIPDAIDWSLISPIGQATLRQIVAPLSLGYTLTEVAADLGFSRTVVALFLRELRDEIERAA